ncbi:MAG: ferredoxin-NADP reductase, partial [Rhodospirillaceae bacterium]
IEAAVVIGNGNVAVDCARVLLRTPQGMASSDLPEHVGKVIHNAPLTDVYMVGRRGPIDAKFTNVELREMGELTEATPVVKAEQLPDDLDGALAELDGRDRRLKERNLKTLAEFTERAADGKRKRVHLEFYAQPVEILGGERVEGIRFERTQVVDGRASGTGETFYIPCGLVIAAIGYRSEPMDGAPYDEKNAIIPNDDGRVDDGLYAVGWIKRGPTGVISSNRPDGETVAQHIAEDFAGDSGKAGRAGLEATLKARSVRWISFADWKRIDELERAGAADPSPRRKFVTVDGMLAALDDSDREAANG